MTAEQLAAQGIALARSRVRPFPNSCRSAGNARLTISDQLLERFRARGFTLESVCLGLSSRVRFDPESGRQLPLAAVDEQEVPLNLPNCFRNGVADLECNARVDTWWGSTLKRNEQAESREFANRFDAMVRQHIARNRVSGVFKVEDLGKGLFTSSYEWLLATSALPRGYGYALHGPEGDDPEVEKVDLGTFRNKPGRPSLWND